MGFDFGKALVGSGIGGAVLGPFGALAGGYAAGSASKPGTGIPGVPFPTTPQFQPVSSSFGSLPANFAVGQNQEGLQALRDIALGEGPSPFAQALIEGQNQRASQAISNVGNQAQGAVTNTKNAIAATSGLSAGQSDQLEKAADRQALFARQNIRNQSNVARDAILGQDADLQQRILNTLPTLEAQALSPQQFNIENLIREKELEDNFNLGIQDINNKIAAAALQSDAIKRSGSKGIIGDLGQFFGL